VWRLCSPRPSGNTDATEDNSKRENKAGDPAQLRSKHA
jgi:hypothetical protein